MTARIAARSTMLACSAMPYPISRSCAWLGATPLPPSTRFARHGTRTRRATSAYSSRLSGASTMMMSAPASTNRRPVHRLLQAKLGASIRAPDDQELLAGARIDGRLDLAEHLRGRDQPLAVEVAAALRELLVFELRGGRPGPLERAARPA